MDNSIRKETLSRILVTILKKFHDAVLERGSHELHPVRDLVGANQLTYSEYNNLQKLQYWGLLLRSGKNDDKKTGKWFITTPAIEFLADTRAVAKHIYVQDGHQISEEPERVKVKDVMGADYIPVVMTRNDYVRNESPQLSLNMDVFSTLRRFG